MGFFGVMALLAAVNSVFGAIFDEDDHHSAGTPPSSPADRCPGRIADALPQGDGAQLVEAFRTDNKQITLCRTSDGELYYYGEFSDRRERGIAMSAERTNNGYVARNPPYSYVIQDGTVTIYKSDRRIGREKVTPEPSPR